MNTNLVYTLEDLLNWPREGYVNLAVIGDPIEHSLSPLMQNAALQQMGEKFANWRYYKFHIKPSELKEAIALFHKKKFRGLNITAPHKVEVLKYLASIQEIAKVMGSVNTLIYMKNGYQGLNTDGIGLEFSIKKELGFSLKGADIILLGAGGASTAVATQCLLADCNKIWVGNRSKERLFDLLSNLSIMGKGKAIGFNFGTIPKDFPKTGIIINTTDVNDKLLLDMNYFSPQMKVFDIIYSPKETALLKKAKELSMECTNGLFMLAAQGAESLYAWTDIKVSPETLWKTLTDFTKNDL